MFLLFTVPDYQLTTKFLRHSLADGTRPWKPVGDDLDAGIDAQKRQQAYFEALDANVPVVQDQGEAGRTKITDAVFQWFAELQLFQGKDQQGKSEKTLRAYNYRVGFFLDFTAQQNKPTCREVSLWGESAYCVRLRFLATLHKKEMPDLAISVVPNGMDCRYLKPHQRRYRAGDRIVFGYCGSFVPHEGVASVWAINPDTNKLPRLVDFSCSDRKTFIAAALAGSKRPDVAAYLHDQRYLRSG